MKGLIRRERVNESITLYFEIHVSCNRVRCFYLLLFMNHLPKVLSCFYAYFDPPHTEYVVVCVLCVEVKSPRANKRVLEFDFRTGNGMVVSPNFEGEVTFGKFYESLDTYRIL